MSNDVTEYELMFKKETKGAYIFIIPGSGNDVMLPKSQCCIFVEDEDEELIEEKVYTVEVQDWIAKKKKIDEGGEEQKDAEVLCTLMSEKETAIRVKNKDFDLWFPKSTVKNKDFPEEDTEFVLKVPEWLLAKKIKESNEEAPTGKRVRNKVKDSVDTSKKVSTDGPLPGADFIEDDIPF